MCQVFYTDTYRQTYSCPWRRYTCASEPGTMFLRSVRYVTHSTERQSVRASDLADQNVGTGVEEYSLIQASSVFLYLILLTSIYSRTLFSDILFTKVTDYILFPQRTNVITFLYIIIFKLLDTTLKCNDSEINTNKNFSKFISSYSHNGPRLTSPIKCLKCFIVSEVTSELERVRRPNT